MDAAMMKDRMWHTHGGHSPHYMAAPIVFVTWIMGLTWGMLLGMMVGKKVLISKMYAGRGAKGMHHHHGAGTQPCCQEHGGGPGHHRMSATQWSEPQEEPRDEGE